MTNGRTRPPRRPCTGPATMRGSLLVASLLAAGCAGNEASPAGSGAPVLAVVEAPAPGPVAVIAISGDTAEPVFDAAREAFLAIVDARLHGRARLATLTSDPARAPIPLASVISIVETLGEAAAPPAAGCLVFATSHGSSEGILLSAAQEILTPEALDAILDEDCGDLPTVVIVSACYSGVFADPPMPAPNRIILTAAARDRSSFGCSADAEFTYFDDALLDALPTATRWDTLHDALRTVIAARERAAGYRPSRPQAVLGRGIAPDAFLAKP